MSEPEYDSLDSPAAVDEEESDRSSERAVSEPLEQDRPPPASLEDGESEEESEEEAEEQSFSRGVGEDGESETSEVAREEESGRSDSEGEGEGERGEEEGEGEEGDRLEGVEMESSDEENMRSAEAHEEGVSPQAEQTEGRTCMYLYAYMHI